MLSLRTGPQYCAFHEAYLLKDRYYRRKFIENGGDPVLTGEDLMRKEVRELASRCQAECCKLRE
jgi:hypothetical protein